MLDILSARRRQGYRTAAFPAAEPTMPDRFRGLPVIDAAKCESGCTVCADACPTRAIEPGPGGERPTIDLGKCLFCTACTDACPTGALAYSNDYRLAVRNRVELIRKSGEPAEAYPRAKALETQLLRVYGRSISLRQVSAGGCNACEADVNVLNTLVFDLSRFGIRIKASPRHCDGLIITGPVTENMREALKIAYDATPDPKIVIAVGACAISGGPFAGLQAQHNGAESVVPVDLYIPGCPPHPWTILDGLLRLLGRR